MSVFFLLAELFREREREGRDEERERELTPHILLHGYFETG